MKKINIPDRYNYIAAFLTFRCGLGCSYCINEDSGILRNQEEIEAGEWVEGLNRLEMSDDLLVTLEGGEPTSYKGFYEIIEKTRHPLAVLTNLQFDTDEFIRKVDPKWLDKRDIPGYKSIRASFHSEKMDLEETIAKTVKLQDAGFNIGLFALNLPEAVEENMQMAELARKNNVYFFIKDFLGYRDERLFGHFKYLEALDGTNKSCECRIKELLIAPDGQIYRCHRDLYHKEDSIGQLLDPDFQVEDIFRPCDNYGNCNPCDIKLKTNRYLQMGSCSVEIRPLDNKG